MKNSTENPPKNLICFSHLRWDFVFQRPQHLLSRFAKEINVYFFEEPVFDAEQDDYLTISCRANHLRVVTPHLSTQKEHTLTAASITKLLDHFFKDALFEDWIFWYYTPMALLFSDKFKPKLIVYDCMDELSAFKFAAAELPKLELQLMNKADLVFTGGYSLFEAKKNLHPNIHPFPSSIEKEHFAQARQKNIEPADQSCLNGIKIGFFGVIDERFDLELIGAIAAHRPDWQLILIGPVLKIEKETLPVNHNIHYLGQKSYSELPAYLSGWDIALIPFLINEATRYISPTKTPEYLAAGIPVVSTPIRDVIKPYGIKKLVSIATGKDQFIEAIESQLDKTHHQEWRSGVDQFLNDISWDHTYTEMCKQIYQAIKVNNNSAISIAS